MEFDLPEKLNIDELFESEENTQNQKKQIYLKVLNRVHKKILTTSRLRNANKYCFFIIPEVILGVPKYNIQQCKSFIFKNLIDNGFEIKYTHPNLLFISWNHILPSYLRRQIKKDTGYSVNSNGEIQNKKTVLELKNDPGPKKKVETSKENVKSTENYVNTGIYNFDFLKDLKLT